jgi:hypothetical protein
VAIHSNANCRNSRRGKFRASSTAEAVMLAARIDRAPQLGRRFLLCLDSPWKEQVVFQMNVLTQVGLETGQSLV